MTRLILLFLLIFLSTNGFSQTFWRVENERGEELLLTIHLNTGNNTFETYTRKDALKEMAGTFMYMMAKTAGKIKYPELMHGEGNLTYNGDTTFYNGKIEYPERLFTLKAKTWKNNFLGLLTDTKNKTTILTGEKIASDKPLKDYASLIDRAYSLAEQYYWDADLKKSSDWKSFKSDMDELKPKIADDYELAMTMMWLGKKLTQVPHEIRKLNIKTPDPQQKKNNCLKIITANKAILFLNNIPDTKEEMDQLFKEIQDKHIEKLIIEASGNRNLTINSALLLADHLTPSPTNWGCYLTRSWTETENSIPQPTNWVRLLKNPRELSGLTNAIFREKGLYLKTESASAAFKGKVYFLINKRSSNVAEALAIYLKNEKLATLVGQKSAGAPALTNIYELDKQYRILIPFAQFYDKNGKSYHGTGVEPDLTAEQDAMGYVLKL
ncbi:MAG: S41 family peptidase [Bacteroidia bacterium]|nr:S41 family peptidase [Bacteroidia bacterium]